jgi:hypothetical protein
MTNFIAVLRWLARLSGLMITGGFVALAAGKMLSPQSSPPSKLTDGQASFCCPSPAPGC